MIIWNPWHGCHKVSEGCAHCYMYFLDSTLLNPSFVNIATPVSIDTPLFDE